MEVNDREKLKALLNGETIVSHPANCKYYLKNDELIGESLSDNPPHMVIISLPNGVIEVYKYDFETAMTYALEGKVISSQPTTDNRGYSYRFRNGILISENKPTCIGLSEMKGKWKVEF